MVGLLKKQLTSVLIKPSGPDCNLDCTYWFYLEKSELFSEKKEHRMIETVLEEMTKQIMQQAGSQISFAWQGVEPTLMGIPFFEKAIELQKKYGGGKIVANNIQTKSTMRM